MADKNNGGSKTEKPTPKRIRDARKKGDVAKSKDLSSIFMMFYWIVVFWLATQFIGDNLMTLMESVLVSSGMDFYHSLHQLGWLAIKTFLIVSTATLIPAMVIGLLVSFLQTGPIFTIEKVKPKLENLNPVEGVKRMFSLDNLVEVFKSIAKAAILLFITWLVFKAMAPQIIKLLNAPSNLFGEAIWQTAFKLCLWSSAVFVLVSFLDNAYQRYSFEKKLRMSLRDIKQELKDTEGDPHIKQQRQQLHQEWSQQSVIQATREANVLLVNPTHIAIALNYDGDNQPIPIVTARGKDELARDMRSAAEEYEIPILRNVEVARTLYRDTEDGDPIPQEFFDIIAEVLIWAREVKNHIQEQKYSSVNREEKQNYVPPGEDLTLYPSI